MKQQRLTAKLTALVLVVLILASLSVTVYAEIWPDMPAPTLSEIETMARSRNIKTSSNTGVKLELPTQKEMLDEPFRAYTDNGKGHGSIYIMPVPKGGNGYLGTVETDTEVWIVAETKYYYFFVTEDGWLGWNGKSYFYTDPETTHIDPRIIHDSSMAPTLSDLETLATSRDIKTRSNTGVKLELPSQKEMLDEPFRAYTDNGKGHGSIYIMPVPKGGNGYLGTVETDTEVWIVAETDYYYFFVTDDGWLGWNGKSFFW